MYIDQITHLYDLIKCKINNTSYVVGYWSIQFHLKLLRDTKKHSCSHKLITRNDQLVNVKFVDALFFWLQNVFFCVFLLLLIEFGS